MAHSLFDVRDAGPAIARLRARTREVDRDGRHRDTPAVRRKGHRA
ncbi:MAG TPA: hypothetical protein VLA82_00065 [Actinomycetota bacterium]|nr:hypothetical protein [Actinomycetota bacterium]